MTPMDDNTPPPAPETPPTALSQQAVANESPPAAPPIPSGEQRPEWLPEKFWNAKDGKAEYDKLAISYQNMEKAFASKKAAPTRPGEGATPEQIAAYYAEVRKITGAPEKPEDYGLKAPEKLPEGVEWNADLATKAAGIAHKYGVPPEALQELVALNNENISSLIAKSQEVQKAQYEELINGMNSKWGGDSKNNWQRASRGTVALGINADVLKSNDVNELREAIILMALGHDKALREDAGLVTGDNDTQTYQEQLTKIQSSDDFQGKNGPEKQQEALQRAKRVFDAMHA